jgi:hypothetical protein
MIYFINMVLYYAANECGKLEKFTGLLKSVKIVNHKLNQTEKATALISLKKKNSTSLHIDNLRGDKLKKFEILLDGQ